MRERCCKNKDRYLLKTALMAAVAAVLALLPAVIAGGGMLALTDDFTYQQQIFNIYNASLYRDDVSWSWLLDIGSDPVTSLSFYNLTSPFTLVLALFPAKVIPYLTAPMLVIKYIVAALGAAVFVKKFVKKPDVAVLGGLLYAFSGIQTVSLLFPFHDAMALFPWLMVCFEEIIRGRRPGVFACMTALCAMTNYYLFFGEVVFLVLWFVFRVLLSGEFAGWKSKLKSFGVALGEGVLGVMMAGAVLVPSFLAVASNPRVSSMTEEILYHSSQYVTLLQAYFLPADVMGMRNYLFQKGCSSCAICLPLLAMAYVFAYIKEKPRKSYSWLAIAMVLVSLVPVLNSVFSFFNANYYARWFFMPALVFSAMSCAALDGFCGEENDLPAKRKSLTFGAAFNLGCVFLTVLTEIAAVVYFKFRGAKTITSGVDKVMLAVYGAAGIASAAYVLTVTVKLPPKRLVTALTAGVMLLAVLTTGAAAVRYTYGGDEQDYYEAGFSSREGYLGKYRARELLTCSQELGKLFPEGKNYRVRTDWHDVDKAYFAGSYDNISLLTGIPSVNSFISTLDGSVFEFYGAVGDGRGVVTKGSFSEELMALLSARYFLTVNREVAENKYCGRYIGEYTYPSGYTVYVYEYENYAPMGFTYDKYITKEELAALPAEERAGVMLSFAVLEEKDVEALREKDIHLTHAKETDVKPLKEAVERLNETGADYFEMTDYGFNAEFVTEEPALAYFSVPCAKGFTVTVNGKEVDVIDSAGMMAVPLDAGQNLVIATYRSPGEIAGTVLSCAGIFLTLSIVIITIIRRKKRQKTAV